MSRGWWARIRREARGTAPVAPATPEPAPEAHREPVRLPRGEVVWLCLTPSGAKSDHPTEQAALNRAAMSDGAVVYPVVIDERESA
jgi:hypothetical protein